MDELGILAASPTPMGGMAAARMSYIAPRVDPGTSAGPGTPVEGTAPPCWMVGRDGDLTFNDATVTGWSQNIVVQNNKGRFTADNVLSMNAWGASQFNGQGLYIENNAGAITVTRSMFGWNGNPRNGIGKERSLTGYATPTPYKHGAYHNQGNGPAVYDQCIFVGNGNAGLQTRSMAGTVVKRSVFLDCGEAILAIEGGLIIEDCVIFGGGYVFDGSGWTCNVAVRAYWPVVMNRNWIISRGPSGSMGQSGLVGLAGYGNHPRAKVTPQGCINCGGEWVHTDPSFTWPVVSNTKDYYVPTTDGRRNIDVSMFPKGTIVGAGTGGVGVATALSVPVWAGDFIMGSENHISGTWPGGLWWGECGPTAGIAVDAPSDVVLPYGQMLGNVLTGGSVPAAIVAIRERLGLPAIDMTLAA